MILRAYVDLITNDLSKSTCRCQIHEKMKGIVFTAELGTMPWSVLKTFIATGVLFHVPLKTCPLSSNQTTVDLG